jgi:hypothetical protein
MVCVICLAFSPSSNPAPDTKQTIVDCHKYGVAVKIITGDPERTQKWQKCVDSCSDALKYLNSSDTTTYGADPEVSSTVGMPDGDGGGQGASRLTENWGNIRVRALVRRGLALEKLKKVDEQQRDAEAVLAADADNSLAQGLLSRAQARKAAQAKAEKDMARKMFA